MTICLITPASIYINRIACTHDVYPHHDHHPVLLFSFLSQVSCNGDNPAFWKHEWSKHGTCANMTQLEYFQTGLKLHQRYVDQCDDDAKKRNSKYIDCRICLDMKLNQYDC